MGKSNSLCDDGKSHLEMDWDGLPNAYQCNKPSDEWLKSLANITALEKCYEINSTYTPTHHCMTDPIIYDNVLPTHHDHRPVWPKYGEYLYVPPQRWLHNIEHGAIVMHYHPCADKNQVDILKKLVVKCLRKHIITANILLDETRPLALVAWGCRLTMNTVDNNTVIAFIKKHALNGPEGHYDKEGDYSEALIKLAEPPLGSDYHDSHVCPN
ncbi:uncharacterized protein LOC128955864 [Oppia nitens]|uniref:uncharacterized protein LOC128955864 n=1 Tax=Oppia nitens TaxID=1686743 RepID=UPI0023DBB9DE|nr:uncharacterized protein LOC128955864 [Oppia nitens]